jgi:cell wall assembly regulator SMI1
MRRLGENRAWGRDHFLALRERAPVVQATGGESLRRIASSWKVIEAVLKENAHSAYKALKPPATEAAIVGLERLVNAKLPRDLIASFQIHNGMRGHDCFVNYMSLLPVAGMRYVLRCQRRVQLMGEFGGNPYVQTAKIKNDVRWRIGWIPVMTDAGGNLLVLDLDPASAGSRGQMFPWFNNGEGKMRVVAESFAAWIDSLAEELLHRRFGLDNCGGIQLRKRLA